MTSNTPSLLDVDTAQQQIINLFNNLRIKKVVFVDDVVLPEVDAAWVMKVLDAETGAAEILAPWLPGFIFDAERDVVFDQIVSSISSLEATQSAGLCRELVILDNEARDSEDLLRLRDVIPEGITLTLLTPAQWHGCRAELIGECAVDSRTLFLFDYELNVDKMDLGFRNGADIIKGMSQSNPTGFGTLWFCGMLSHTLQRGDEIQRWRTLAADNGIELKFFMPIAKNNLEHGAHFFAAVYRTVITTYCENMKGVAAEGFEEAVKTVLGRFVELDPLDFEHMVVKSSEDEGVSELETLLRLYAILQKDEVKRSILKEDRFSNFSSAAAAVKMVADTDRALSSEARRRLCRLRRDELYESGELVNGFHDPLRNGDLFEIGADRKQYVLIAQPCDIMVRKGGKRAREDNFKIAVLAPISISPMDSEVKTKGTLGFELPYFGKDGEQRGIVEFAPATVTNLRVLDLAVMNKAGKCEITPLVVEQTPPVIPTRAWQDRVSLLLREFKALGVKIEESRTTHGDKIAKLLAESWLPRGGLSKALNRLGTYNNTTFSYPMRRCGRIRDPLAVWLLSAFSRYLARDAHDHDYAAGEVTDITWPNSQLATGDVQSPHNETVIEVV